jgi:hypothetical protein
VNASPDLRSQLTRSKWLPPRTRASPIEAVLLTDADLDHALGLFLLRENESPVLIHASVTIQEAVEEGLRITEVLKQYCGIRWVTAPSTFQPLCCGDGKESGLEYKVLGIVGAINILAACFTWCGTQRPRNPYCSLQRSRGSNRSCLMNGAKSMRYYSTVLSGRTTTLRGRESPADQRESFCKVICRF